MSSIENSKFSGNENKIFITKNWDYPILSEFSEFLGRPLDYFGLSGPNLEDVIAWRNLLHRIRSVERHRQGEEGKIDKKNQSQAVLCAFRNNIKNVSIIQGNIEEVILTGIDCNQRIIPGACLANDFIYFEHTLVNLDFFGGIGYIKDGGITRIEAIKKLFERQSSTNFIFILNINVRDGIPNEINEYLQDYMKHHEDINFSRSAQWYLEQNLGKKYKLKAIVPILIKAIAEVFNFKTTCFPPLAYTGNGNAEMVHFVFSCEYGIGKLHRFSSQTPHQLLNLPLLEVSQGNLILPEQHPNYDFSGIANQVAFLSESIQADLRNQLDLIYKKS
jgi:hypothetical protein